MQDQLRLAVQDSLTGLYNRHYAIPQMARIAERARRSGRAYAVMLLDLDRFKSVNDLYGHVAGDHVLSEVANRLRRELRPKDLLARIGGEEFLVVLPDATQDSARQTAERLCRAIEATTFSLPDGSGALRVTISVGLALETGGQGRSRSDIAASGGSTTGGGTGGAETSATGPHEKRDDLPAITGTRASRTVNHPGNTDGLCTAKAMNVAPSLATPDRAMSRGATDGATANTVFQRADRALLCAKAQGRNQVTVGTGPT